MRTFRTFLFILLIVASAHAAIRMTPETGIVDPVRAPIHGNQTGPVIATDGDQFLLFWTTRDGVSVAHVAADGRLLSSRLALVSPWAFQLSATWTGAVYLATWGDYAKNALMAATFNANGDLLSGPTAIVSGRAQTRTGALASNGRRILLLYCYNNVGGVEAAIFDVRGNLIANDRPIVALGPATNFQLPEVPTVTSDGEEFGVVWRTNAYVSPSVLMHDFHLIRVGEDGGAIGSPIDIGRTDETADFSVAFGGGLYAIVTTEPHIIKPGSAQARLVRFSVDARRGSVARMPAIDIDLAHAHVFWSGSTFVAFWMRYGTASFAIMTLPFSGANESIAPAPVSSLTGNAASFELSMLSNGHHVLAAWNQETGAVYGAVRQGYGTLFDSEAAHPGTADAPALLSLGWSRQLRPVMASSTTGSLIIWIEDGYSGGHLLGMRTDAAGAFVDRAPFEIATGVSQATAVFAGGVYIVAWQEGGDSPTVVARSVGVDGSLGLRIALGAGWSVAAASNGSTALVVFAGTGLAGYRFDAFGRQIDTTPLVIGAGGEFPQVASNGTDFFVAWNRGDYRGDLPPGFDIFGARVTAGGAVDAEPLPIATAPAEERLEAIASDGRDYLIAYEWNQLTYGTPTKIETKVVLREGQLDGATATDQGTIIASDATYAVSLSGDATGYWSAYVQLNGTGNLLRLDKRGNRVLAAVPVATELSSVALGRLPGGAVRMLYARAVADGEFTGTSMLFSRFIGEDLAGRSRAARH
ncbi:MAG: hypothetical protein QOF63_579 [Thermoanaerobaculia bacterium]|jgi:hypothetical protein|nr:hypothetical protein [Thermoanaerobaculia bacterium]